MPSFLFSNSLIESGMLVTTAGPSTVKVAPVITSTLYGSVSLEVIPPFVICL